MGDSSSDTLRVLFATDCHLGYLEKDEVRRHDSFQAFDEICSIAEQMKVNFVLLGGDLFHENKPSRSTLVKAIEILRCHCLSDKPVQFQAVSDQTVNFANMFSHANYEDPHFNVDLPVFSIHGNHDDPAGVYHNEFDGCGVEVIMRHKDNLSAVDILSTCNLINYFGKMILGGSGVGQISLSPILIRKGETSVALYGLGNIRDERLSRMFQTPHAVQWIRPESQEGLQLSDWFNILVLHQNRVKVNPKNAIHEHMLPEFLDFIVWGHEHECLVDPQEVLGKGFHITQPGSSVATSLIDGESKPKHVLLREIKGNQYRPTKIPLASVGPFEYAEVVLKDEPEIDPNDHNSVLERLDDVVDYSGFMTINPQKFGQKYVGKVANPQDILIFTKASKKGRNKGKFDESERLRPEELNQQNIEALVAESTLKTKILPINDLDVALHEFVKKYDKTAFEACVLHNLDETRFEMHGTTSMCWVGRDFVILAADSRSSFGPSLGYESNSPFLEGKIVSDYSLKILPLTQQIAFASAGSVQEFNVSQKYLLDHMVDETKTGQDKNAVEKLADLCLGRILVHADNSYIHLFGGVIDKVPKCWSVRNHKNKNKKTEEVELYTAVGSGARFIRKMLKDAHAEYGATALVEEATDILSHLLLIAAFNDHYTGGILTMYVIEAKETPDEILKETPQPFITKTVLESMIEFYETRLMRMKSFKHEEGLFIFLFYKRGEIKQTELQSWLRKKKKKVTFIGHPLMELANNYYAHRVEFETIEAAKKFFGGGIFNPPKFEIPFTSEIELRFYELGETPKHIVLVAPQSLTMLKALNPSQNMKKKILHPNAPLSTTH